MKTMTKQEKQKLMTLLASLLGYNDSRAAPNWLDDNNAAFSLNVSQGVWRWRRSGLMFRGILVSAAYRNIKIRVPFADFPDEEAAMRYAIVVAVIAKLQYAQQKHQTDQAVAAIV
jgi:hypothetical protein